MLLCRAPAEAVACETWAKGWTWRNMLCLPALVSLSLLWRPGRKLRSLLRAQVAQLLLWRALLRLHRAQPRPRLWKGRKMRLLRRALGARWLLRGWGPAGVAPGAHQILGVPREVQSFAPVPAGGWAVPAH